MNRLFKLLLASILSLATITTMETRVADAALTGCSVQITGADGTNITSVRGQCTGWTGSGFRFYRLKAQCFPSGEWHYYSGGWFAAGAGWQDMYRSSYWGCTTLANASLAYRT